MNFVTLLLLPIVMRAEHSANNNVIKTDHIYSHAVDTSLEFGLNIDLDVRNAILNECDLRSSMGPSPCLHESA